jgi:hypothetical protein
METRGFIERTGASTQSAFRARWNAALVFLTATCALPCVIGLVDAVWYQWRDGPAWVPMSNPHSGSLLVPLLAAFIGAILLAPVLCVDLISQVAKRNAPFKTQLLCLTVISASLASYLPGFPLYAALAVAVLGPGQHSQHFQANAARGDSTVLLNALYRRGAAISPGLLGSAAYHGSTSVMRRLIEIGIPVDGPNGDSGRTLHQAVDGRQLGSVEFLLKANADPHKRDARSLSPIDLADRRKEDRIAALLRAASQPSNGK